MTVDLPRALEPWRTSLALFPPDLAPAIGDVVARLSVLVGPLERESRSLQGEPDGVSGIGRRGPLERLLMTEWALLQEVPLEFLRRAATRELGFYELARREPSADRSSVVLFDSGIDQLGAPRVVHLAALVLLAQRAADANARFSWGLLHDPATTLYAAVTPAAVRTLLLARRQAKTSAEDVDRWTKALTPPKHPARSPTGIPEEREVWLVGGATTPDPLPGLPHPRIVVADLDDPERPLGVEVTVTTVRQPPRTARLDLPLPAVGVRLLRNPFEVPPAPRTTAAPELGPGATPFVFSEKGRLFSRSTGGGLLTLTPGGDAKPRVYVPGPNETILGVGVIRKKQRTAILVRREGKLGLQVFGRRNRGVTWSATLGPADLLPIEDGGPLLHVFPLDHDDVLVLAGHRLIRIRAASDPTKPAVHELVLPARAACRAPRPHEILVMTAEDPARLCRCWPGANKLVESATVYPHEVGELVEQSPVLLGPTRFTFREAGGAYRTMAVGHAVSAGRFRPRSGVTVVGAHQIGSEPPRFLVVDAARRCLEFLDEHGSDIASFAAPAPIVHAQTNPHAPHVALLLESKVLEVRALEGFGLVASYDVGGRA